MRKSLRVSAQNFKYSAIDYDREFNKRMNKNIEEVQALVASGDRKKLRQIEKYADTYGLSMSDIIDRINKGCRITISIFAINPVKQTLHETVAAKYISELPIVSNFKRLKQSGPEALYISGGVVKNLLQPKMKAIDFYWEYQFKGETLRFYAAHKFTNERGGAQDNQLYDVSKSNSAASKIKYKDVFFLSITDGEYYELMHSIDKTQEITKLEFLSQYEGPRNKSTTSNHFLIDVIPIIIDWLELTFENPKVYKKEVEYLNKIHLKAKLGYDAYLIDKINM